MHVMSYAFPTNVEKNSLFTVLKVSNKIARSGYLAKQPSILSGIVQSQGYD